MRNCFKRGLSMLLALLLLTGTLSGLTFNAAAEGIATDQTGISEDRKKAAEDLGKMAVAVALAYFDKGHSVQYDGKSINSLVHRFNGGKSRSTNGESPEYATPHETLYTVCSDFADQVYREAFGFDLLGNGSGYIWTGTLSNPDNDPSTVVWSRQPFSGDPTTDMWGVVDADGNVTTPGMFHLAQPGDVFTAFSMKKSTTNPGEFTPVGGHVMIWAGDVTGDGRPDIIHSGGRHMALENGTTDAGLPIEAQTDRREYFDENDPDYLKDKAAYEAAIGGTYQHKAHSSFGSTTNGGSIRISDAETYIKGRYDKDSRRITLRRPAWAILDEENTPQVDAAVLKAAQYRVGHPGLAINRTLLNKTRFNSALPGEIVTLEIELLNNSSMHVGFESSGTDDDFEDNTTEDGSGEVEQAALQSVEQSESVSAAVSISETGSAAAGAELQAESTKDGESYSVTVTETVPAGAKLVEGFEGATQSGDTMTLEVSLEPGETKKLTATFEITAELGETVTFGGGFVGDIPSNSIPITVGGKKLSETQTAKLAAIANGDYNDTLADAGANSQTLGEVVYKQILGLDPKLPQHTELAGKMIKKISVNKTIGTTAYNKSSYRFRTKDEIAEADMPMYRMMVPGCWGGQYIWYEFGHERCADPRDMHLEPGDVIVRANSITSDSSCQQLVYLGNGKYLSYDAATNTYPIVNEREFFRCLFYRYFYVLRPSLSAEAICSASVHEEWSLTLADNVEINYYLADPDKKFTEDSEVLVDGVPTKLTQNAQTGEWYVPISKKVAKDMSKETTIQLTAKDADGETHYGKKRTVSVRDYAAQVMGTLDWTLAKEAKLGRAMIGMLNYGAEAQKYFDHNTGDLANKNLTDAEQNRMTVYTEDKLGEYRVKKRTVNDDAGLYYASSCVLGSSQALRFYLRLPTSRTDRESLNYSVTYKSYNGKERTVTRSFAELTESSAEGVFYFEVPDMAAADVKTEVTLTVKKNGSAITTVTDSIASYCARVYDTYPDAQNLADAVLIYGLSARDYFFEPTLTREENELPIY